MQFTATPEVLQLIAWKLTELVQRDLGYSVRFEWPENTPTERGTKMAMVVIMDRPLDSDQRVILAEWCKKNLGVEWPLPTFWDRIRED